MATINLLPWRDELREEQKKEFLTILVLFAIFAAAVIFGWQFILNGQIEYQQSRNAFLKQEIAKLDKEVQEIKELKKQKAQLEKRMEVIQSLQGDRPEIVYIFDQLVRTLPDGVYFTSVTRTGPTLNLEGVAESNNRVSSLMRQLDNSKWFTAPNLQSVNANPDFGEQANTFTLAVNIVSASSAEDEANNNNKRRK